VVAMIIHKQELLIEREKESVCVIKQQLLRDLWIESFGNKQKVSFLDFIEALRNRAAACQPTIKDLFMSLHPALKGNHLDVSVGLMDATFNASFDGGLESEFVPVELNSARGLSNSTGSNSNTPRTGSSSIKDSTVASSAVCNELINQLALVLDYQLDLSSVNDTTNSDDTGMLAPQEIAKLSRHIDIQEYRFESVLRGLLYFTNVNLAGAFTENKSKRCVRIIPPRLCADAEILWEGGVGSANGGRAKEVFESCVYDTGGLVNIYGPRFAGKTARILSLVHNLDKSRDALWVDLTGCGTRESMQARTASQLFLHNAFSEENFQRQLFSLVSSLRPGAVIVFDGIDNNPNKPMEAGMKHFHHSVVDSLQPLMQHTSHGIVTGVTIIYVSTHNICSDIHEPQSSVRCQVLFRLSDDSSESLARILYPADAFSLFIGGCRYPGIMYSLARHCTIQTIRNVKKDVNRDGDAKGCLDKWDSVFYGDIGTDLTSEESLLASVLIRGLPMFDLGLAWALSRATFENDILRWYGAWLGLVQSGWLLHYPDLGTGGGYYYIPAEATVPNGDVFGLSMTIQQQWDEYIYYWAYQLARVHEGTSTSAENGHDFSYIDAHHPHFRTLFSCFVSFQHAGPSISRQTFLAFGPTPRQSISAAAAALKMKLMKDMKCSDIIHLARLLAGRLSKVTQVVLPPSHGLALTEAVLRQVHAGSGTTLVLSRNVCFLNILCWAP
jgi:hypothetical protein